jgi:hypothetical protein
MSQAEAQSAEKRNQELALAQQERGGALAAGPAPTNMLEVVMRASMDPNIDPARLEKFLQIGRELESDKAKKEWAVAFRAAKDDLDGVSLKKNGKIVYAGKNGAPDSTIHFLKYDDIADAVKPILRKHGLTASYTYEHEATPPKTICVMTLLHSGGHSQQFRSVPLPMVDSGGGKSDIQGAGSVMTYGRRYAIQAAFDIVAEGQDNDGSGQREQPKPVTDEQIETIENIVRACDEKNPGFKQLFANWMAKEFRVSSPAQLMQGQQLKAVMLKLAEKQKALGI